MTKFVARWFLRLTGWELEGSRPVETRFVLIAAPHTSNWDLPYLLALGAMYDVKISWMGKHQLFRPPLGWVMRAVGGIPIVRHQRRNMVDQMLEAFSSREEMALVVPVEATRARTEHWKSGFYHIASQADVPIVMGYLDYARKRGGFGPSLTPSGDVRRDMDELRAFYEPIVGRHPEDFGPVRLEKEI